MQVSCECECECTNVCVWNACLAESKRQCFFISQRKHFLRKKQAFEQRCACTMYSTMYCITTLRTHSLTHTHHVIYTVFYPYFACAGTCHLNFEFSLTIYNRIVRITPSSNRSPTHRINTLILCVCLCRHWTLASPSQAMLEIARWLERWSMGTLKRYDNGYRNIRIAKL